MNPKLLIYVLVLVIGMSSTCLAIPRPTSTGDGVRYADWDIAPIWRHFRVLEMAKEFPLVKFRGLDLGACCSDPR